MKCKAMMTLGLTLFFVTTAAAQQPMGGDSESNPPITLSELQPTAQMWFYEQAMRQYHNPQAAVRAKAEYRAAQRQRRLASSKWFGISNSRPTVSSTPYTSSYSPTWTSGNSNPFHWHGASSRPIVVIRTVDDAGVLRR